MKKLSILTLACITLCACSTQVTEQDYKNAFIDYVGDNTLNADNVTLAHEGDITVNDSIEYYTVILAQEYQNLLAEKKQAWEDKQADCLQDEKANVLRHEDYMKKYNDAKRKYGNDIKYKSKIDGYLKAAQKLPSNHEEYLKFDRSRSYSFTRDAEQLQAAYEEFLQMGVDNYVVNHPFVTPLCNERDRNEVVASVYNVTYTTADGHSFSEDFVFGCKPVEVKEIVNYDALNIANYKSFDTSASEGEEAVEAQ